MQRMSRLTVQLTGLTPLLQHGAAGMLKARSGASSGINRKVIPAPEDEAEFWANKRPDGTYYQPTVAVKSALVSAGAGKRIGKMGAVKVLMGAVYTTEEDVTLFDPDTGDPILGHEVDVRRVVVQKAGVIRARAKLPRWRCELDLEYDPSDVTPKLILEALEFAGSRIGIGDYRPEKGGPFGRFTAEIVSG